MPPLIIPFKPHQPIEGLKPGGIFVLKCDFSPGEIGEKLLRMMRYMAEKISLLSHDAEKIESDIGLGMVHYFNAGAFFNL